VLVDVVQLKVISETKDAAQHQKKLAPLSRDTVLIEFPARIAVICRAGCTAGTNWESIRLTPKRELPVTLGDFGRVTKMLQVTRCRAPMASTRAGPPRISLGRAKERYAG